MNEIADIEDHELIENLSYEEIKNLNKKDSTLLNCRLDDYLRACYEAIDNVDDRFEGYESEINRIKEEISCIKNTIDIIN